MKKISRIISAQKKLANTLYKYEVEDELKNKEIVSSIQEYEVGEVVKVIWSQLSDQYNTPYLKKLCQKCYKQILDPVQHEFCNLKYHS